MNGSVTGWFFESTRSYAVVMSADLTSAGVAFGYFPRYSAPRPATCGDDIDVPDMKPNVGADPFALFVAARIATPGAETSGLMTSLPSARIGPRLEKPAICGVGVSVPVTLSLTSVAVAPAVLRT